MRKIQALPRPSLTNRITKKAALGGPSSDETFPLREKTKFYTVGSS